MAQITCDLTELPRAVREQIKADCTREFGVQARLAKLRQQKIAKFYHDHTPRSIEGVGEQTLAVDPFVVNYLQALGLDYWGDLDVRPWLAKRHEEFRVKSTGTKLMVGFGSKVAGARKMFSKTYGASPEPEPEPTKTKA